jgi:hypothetical protein
LINNPNPKPTLPPGQLGALTIETTTNNYSLSGLGIPGTDVVTADLNRDGSDEFLFGIGTSLQCVGRQGLLWNINVAGIPGEIALADVDLDGNLEIIVCTSDGYLKIYK